MFQKSEYYDQHLNKSLQYVEGWATLKWHRMHGGSGFPTSSFEEEHHSARRGCPSNLPSLFDVYMIIEQSLKEMRTPWVLMGLLLWMYPKKGTYEREGNYENFRPKELVDLARDFGWSDTELTEQLKRTERRFLNLIAKKIKNF